MKKTTYLYKIEQNPFDENPLEQTFSPVSLRCSILGIVDTKNNTFMEFNFFSIKYFRLSLPNSINNIILM